MLSLVEKIETQDAKIAVIGLGYVGLPLAISFAINGFSVVGIDIDKDKLDTIQKGHWPLAKEEVLPALLCEVISNGSLAVTNEFSTCSDTDIIILCVPTPIFPTTTTPNLSILEQAIKDVAQYLQKNTLFIIESTIPPGTTKQIVTQIPSYYIAHCPERVNPGNLWCSLYNTPHIVGGFTEEATHVALTLYHQIGNYDPIQTDAQTAEVVKTAENALRNLQIAHANELAIICHELGVNFWEVQNIINSRPDRHVLNPGLVGGPCIPKDPYLLLDSIDFSTFTPLLYESCQMNNYMLDYIANLIFSTLQSKQINITTATLVVLGKAYKPNSEETIGSYIPQLVALLQQWGITVKIYDPLVYPQTTTLYEIAKDADGIVFAVKHDIFKNIDWQIVRSVMNHKIFIDLCGISAPAGFTTIQLGNGKQEVS